MGIIDTISGLFSGYGPQTNDTKYHEAVTDLLQYDLGRNTYFQVEFFSRQLSEIPSSRPSTLKFVCHSAELPGETFEVAEQRIYGVTEKFPIRTHLNDITLSFYTRGSGLETSRMAFLYWISQVSGRNQALKFPGSTDMETNYNLRYKNDYAGTVVITQFASTGEPLLDVILYEAFPIAINQVPLDWSAENQAQSLMVTFSYREYQYKLYYAENSANYTPGPLGELIGAAIGAAATINSAKGLIKSGNPIGILSNLPSAGLSNFTLSSAVATETIFL